MYSAAFIKLNRYRETTGAMQRKLMIQILLWYHTSTYWIYLKLFCPQQIKQTQLKSKNEICLQNSKGRMFLFSKKKFCIFRIIERASFWKVHAYQQMFAFHREHRNLLSISGFKLSKLDTAAICVEFASIAHTLEVIFKAL